MGLKEELCAVFNSMYDEVYVTDGKGSTLMVNDACCRLYGLPPEKLIGRNVVELVREGVFRPSATVAALERRERATLAQKTCTGRHIIATATPVFDESGALVRVVTNSRDVTELMNLKQRLDENERLIRRYLMELTVLRQEVTAVEGLIAESPAMTRIMEAIKQVARVDSTVLLQGESGVGKDVLAKMVHNLSARAKGPFIKINCGAIPETLMESEIFGYASGAFTGALRNGKPGVFELGHGGTVFLNEVSELPLHLQVKFLDVIQDRQVSRVGGVRPLAVDFRLVTATNRDLAALTKQGRFREDLFYRLNVIPIYVPPLRERREDIPALINQHLERCRERFGTRPQMSPVTMNALLRYEWPGNVRELQNVVERMVVTSNSETILPHSLPAEILASAGDAVALPGASETRVPPCLFSPLQVVLNRVERSMLEEALSVCDSTYAAAQILGISQPTVVRKMQKHGIPAKRTVHFDPSSRSGWEHKSAAGAADILEQEWR